MCKKIIALVMITLSLMSTVMASNELGTPYPFGINGTDSYESAILKAACNYKQIQLSCDDEKYYIFPYFTTLYGIKVTLISFPKSDNDEWSTFQIMLSEKMTEEGTEKVTQFVYSVVNELGEQSEKTFTDGFVLFKWNHVNMGITPMKLGDDGEDSYVIIFYWGNCG